MVDFGPRVPTPAERHGIPGLGNLSERARPPGPGGPRDAAAATLGRHNPGYAAYAARAGRTAGRGRHHGGGRLISVGPRLFGQREPLGAQVQVGHTAGDYLVKGREEAHFVTFRLYHFIL